MISCFNDFAVLCPWPTRAPTQPGRATGLARPSDPLKGEGLRRRTHFFQLQAPGSQSTDVGKQGLRKLSPSPLRGGVGVGVRPNYEIQGLGKGPSS